MVWRSDCQAGICSWMATRSRKAFACCAGRLVRSGPLSTLQIGAAPRTVVESPDPLRLAAALDQAGLEYAEEGAGFLVEEPDPGRVGHAAFVGGVELSALHQVAAGLEDSFLSLVGDGGSEGTPGIEPVRASLGSIFLSFMGSEYVRNEGWPGIGPLIVRLMEASASSQCPLVHSNL